ncbi:MAG: glycosyltransferase [Butyrivibrio sp.]|nr:glycosyltransferase [Butyrivibrio sp.]
MNILFLMAAFEVGGQEVVTAVLADLMVKHNHKVVVACYKKPNPQMLQRLSSNIIFKELGGFNTSRSVITNLRNVLSTYSIDIVINQWGLPYQAIFTFKKASRDMRVKVISVYHNQVDYNGRIADVDNRIKKTNNKLIRVFLSLKKAIVRKTTALSMRYVYNNSDAYVLLSPSYIPLFSRFTGLKHPSKLCVIKNPITIPVSEEKDFNIGKKKDSILYVGRLDYNQKRVDRILDIWYLVSDKIKGWNLRIVGDGPNRVELEQRCKELKLKNVSFEGYKNPVPYYESAKLIMLTSDFEGFPLV